MCRGVSGLLRVDAVYGTSTRIRAEFGLGECGRDGALSCLSVSLSIQQPSTVSVLTGPVRCAGLQPATPQLTRLCCGARRGRSAGERGALQPKVRRPPPTRRPGQGRGTEVSACWRLFSLACAAHPTPRASQRRGGCCCGRRQAQAPEEGGVLPAGRAREAAAGGEPDLPADRTCHARRRCAPMPPATAAFPPSGIGIPSGLRVWLGWIIKQHLGCILSLHGH